MRDREGLRGRDPGAGRALGIAGCRFGAAKIDHRSNILPLRCYSKDGGNRDLGWQKVGACNLANGRACSFKSGGKTYSGKLHDCGQCTAEAQGVCVHSGARVYGPTGDFELNVAPPPLPTVPPRKVTPQVAPGVQPPVAK